MYARFVTQSRTMTQTSLARSKDLQRDCHWLSRCTVAIRDIETTVFDPASVFLSTLRWSQRPSLPVLFLWTIKKLPLQPASFYYPVEETKKSQETAPKKFLAKRSQENLNFFLRKSNFTCEKIDFFLQTSNFSCGKIARNATSEFLGTKPSFYESQETAPKPCQRVSKAHSKKLAQIQRWVSFS